MCVVLRVSVAIITRNRSSLLAKCLRALSKQSSAPLEILVVDNNSTDGTAAVCNKYRKILPINYALEHRIGIPFARNVCISKARGEIIAFLDDDSVPTKTWLTAIANHFQQNTSSVGLIGKTNNANPKNIASAVEQLHTLLWLRRNIANLSKTCLVSSGQVVDFKNAAFKAFFIKNFKMSTTVPFGDVGNNEDLELGHRFYQKTRWIYWDPSVVTYHNNSRTLFRLLYRNFWEGFANQLLIYQFGINTKRAPLKYNYLRLLLDSWKQQKKAFGFGRVTMLFLLLIVYPLFSRFGKAVFVLSSLFHLHITIPQR